ncbi:ATP-binding cassette domain-containing protein [Alkalicoccus halolimnae]|uniref:ATP-binding cassette domain-containing protein n=1 Tax=Alkalicoccus halolimnae TaxID=1667239 RepID=A0AAJ8LW92_9BACI|nr:ATP-binding cassette domain-containing protein [Alkalicoccus halolimnae]
MKAELEFKQVNLHYGPVHALKNINLVFRPHKIYGLFGRNGAGKTSLLSLIASFQKPSSGTVTLNEETLFENARLTPFVYFVYPRSFETDYHKAKRKLEILARHRVYFDMGYALDLADKFKLDLNSPVNTFSKGMAGIFQIICGLAARAPVTIFDEAYLGIDEPVRKLFYDELLDEQTRLPRTFILSTRFASEMEHLLEEIIVLSEGKVVLHDDYTSIISKGISVTGDAEIVDAITKPYEILNEERLGTGKSVAVYGEIPSETLQQARKSGLRISTLRFQDVITQLTKGEEHNETEHRR